MLVASSVALLVGLVTHTSATRLFPASLKVLGPSLGWFLTSLVLRRGCLPAYAVGLAVQGVLASVLYVRFGTTAALLIRIVYAPLLSAALAGLVGGFVPSGVVGKGAALVLLALQLWSLIGGSIMLACYPATVLQAMEPQAQRESGYRLYARSLIDDEDKKVIRRQVPGPRGVVLDAVAIKQPFETEKWVLYFGGNAEFLENTVDDISVIGDGLKANMILFNHRGIGRSTGYVSQVSDLVEDGMAVAQHFIQHERINPKLLVLFGHSIGGGVAAQVAARCLPESPLVIDRSFSTLSDAAAVFSPFTPSVTRKLLPFFVGDLDSVEAWNAIAHRKKIIMYARADEIIRFDVSSIARLTQFSHGGPDEDRVYELHAAHVQTWHNSLLSAFYERMVVLGAVGFYMEESMAKQAAEKAAK